MATALYYGRDVLLQQAIIQRPLGDNPPRARLIYGIDVLAGLRMLGPSSVHMVCTSPPYWGLRDYGTGDGQIGLEQTPEEYIQALVNVFREIKRVLRPDGVAWLNLGDTYIKENSLGLKPKDLAGIPWRVALALQEDGWYLRSAAPWIKRNILPESVSDRPTSALEYIFLLSHPDGRGRYYYDIEAVRIPHKFNRWSANKDEDASALEGAYGGEAGSSSLLRKGKDLDFHPHGGRNRRNTDWFFDSISEIVEGGQNMALGDEGEPLAFVINPRSYTGAHFAVWAPTLVAPMVKATTSEYGVCAACGAPWERQSEASGEYQKCQNGPGTAKCHVEAKGKHGSSSALTTGMVPLRNTVGWCPSCDCGAEGAARPVVLDPFSGSGTTGMVALQMGRNYIGTDLNEGYLDMAQRRILGVAPPKEGEDTKGGVLDMFGDEE